MSALYDRLSHDLRELTLPTLGFDGAAIEQGSPEWHRMRLGVISASRASDLISIGAMAPFPEGLEIVKDGKQSTVTLGGETFVGTKAECVSWVRHKLPPLPGTARNTYMLELIAEVATGQTKEQGRFKPTEWGHEYEPIARDIFGFHTGIQVKTLPFVYGDTSMRYGCSPDGIAGEAGAEIKCPWTSEVYLNFVLNGEIKPEYVDQCQFSMFVTNASHWYFSNYDPRMRSRSFHSVIIERDESKMKTYADAVGQMAYDIDKHLKTLDINFGDQWK